MQQVTNRRGKRVFSSRSSVCGRAGSDGSWKYGATLGRREGSLATQNGTSRTIPPLGLLGAAGLDGGGAGRAGAGRGCDGAALRAAGATSRALAAGFSSAATLPTEP